MREDEENTLKEGKREENGRKGSMKRVRELIKEKREKRMRKILTLKERKGDENGQK